MQNLGYINYKKDSSDLKIMSLKLKILKNINWNVSFIMSLLVLIAIIEFIRFCFDLYVYVH